MTDSRPELSIIAPMHNEAGNAARLVEEHEDIRIFALPREAAVALLDGDRLDNATTIVALGWLARHGAALRARWLSDRKTREEEA